MDENDDLRETAREESERKPFTQMTLENLWAAGVQQAHKDDCISFISLTPWPGSMICAEGLYREGESDRRAGIFIGQELGTVQLADLVEAAREAGDAGFDILISCAFNYKAHSTELTKLGRTPVLKAEIDQDTWESLHSDISRPFDKPKTGRIVVKAINHLGDEVMKVFKV